MLCCTACKYEMVCHASHLADGYTISGLAVEHTDRPYDITPHMDIKVRHLQVSRCYIDGSGCNSMAILGILWQNSLSMAMRITHGFLLISNHDTAARLDCFMHKSMGPKEGLCIVNETNLHPI